MAGGNHIICARKKADPYNRLVEGGALIAESSIDTQPQAHNFPKLYRAIAGLSLAVVVVKAAKRSGSLITARMPHQLGRKVMAVPGTALNPRCRGRNQLPRGGAHSV